VFAFGPARDIFDIIGDFTRGEDLIDLSFLHGMYLIGEMPFEGDATGQLRYFFDGPDLILLGSVDRDLDAEILIVVQGVSGLATEDFIF
jgi:hypothetical protein